jgi:hypothetical protein
MLSNRTGLPCRAYVMPNKTKCAAHLGIGRDRLDPAKASAASAIARRKRSEARKMGALAALERVVQERGEEIAACFMRGVESGDWRAAAAMLERIYGKARERVEVTQPTSVEQVEQMSLAEIRQLRAVTELDSSD